MHRLFMQRMTQAIGIWAALAVGGLIVGMAGYGYYEGMALRTPSPMPQ
jgi:hypothetical protein